MNEDQFLLRGLAIIFNILVCMILVIIIFWIAFFYSKVTTDLPSIELLPFLLEPPNAMLLEPTRIYDRSGEHVLATLENPAAKPRQFLRINQIPIPTQATEVSLMRFSDSLVSVTIAANDPEFWQHPGFSFEGIWSDEHSTIAQNLVVDLLLWNEPVSLMRALRERLLAAQATHAFGREQILTWYLNTEKYGQYVYGADAAARAFFNKSASDLNISESAILVASSQIPSINPFTAPEQTFKNSIELLAQLYLQGLISQEQFDQIRTFQFISPQKIESASFITPEFIQIVLSQASNIIDLERIERGGLKLITTLNYELAMQTSCSLQAQMLRLHGDYQEVQTIEGDDCEAARLLPTLALNNQNLPDEIDANVVILDAQKGELLTLIGANYQDGLLEQSKSSSLSEHNLGTSITPFIYLTGLTRGLSPASLLWDIPTKETPLLFDEFHGPVRLRTALANDYLQASKRVLDQVGSPNVFNISNQMGLELVDLNTSYLDPMNASIIDLLMESRTSLMNLTRAYGIFANQGVLIGQLRNSNDVLQVAQNIQPKTLLSVQDYAGYSYYPDGSSSNLFESFRISVITPQLAYLTTHILSDESARWSSLGHPNPLEIGQPVAAKMGQSLTGNDFWVMGYTPRIVTGVWIGKPASDETQLSHNVAAGLWHGLMQFASRSYPADNFTRPTGIEEVSVCDPSGMLPTENCPAVVDEVFLTENIPTQLDTLYKKFKVNRETGRLATIYTPSEFVTEQIFMIVPPEAEPWALQSGLPLPPDTYDIILTDNQAINPDIDISMPHMYDFVSKNVSIQGTAAGEKFDYFQLRFGKGLNPIEWFEISESSYKPVLNNILAQWDTSNLSGLYSLQLLLVNKDQSVLAKTVQVTIDNIPPDIKFLYPASEQNLDAHQNENITIQLEPSDNMDIQEVKIFIDGRLISTLTRSPFVAAWKVSAGEHTLRATIIDLAGNITNKEITFTIQLSN